MPYKIYKKNGYKVCKCKSEGCSKCFSKKGMTKEKARAQQKALYASEQTNEAIESSVSSNLHFKNLRFPSRSSAVATYHYDSKKDNVDVMIYYTIGKTAEEVDYCHTVIKDNNDIHSKGVSFDDPQSEELSSFASSKGINISPDDIEMAGQDGYSKIEEYINQPDETGEAYEESFKFEKLFQSIVNEEKS
jgi:hypothetical protein